MAIVNLILDEAASLGSNMSCIEDAIQMGRGYGIRLQLYYQSAQQLKLCFPKEQEFVVLANCTQVFFAVNDNWAEYISQRLGDYTIVVNSGGSGTGYSTPSGWGTQGVSNDSRNSSNNWNQAARKLLKPDEILALDRRIAITFVPGMPPIWTRLERYFERPKAKQEVSRFRGLGDVIVALFFAVVAANCCLNVSEAWKEATHGSIRKDHGNRPGSGGRREPAGNSRQHGIGKRPVQR